MKLELNNINTKRRKIAIGFFQFIAKNPCENRLFIQNDDANIAPLKSVLLREEERVETNNDKIESICKKLSISPSLLTNRSFLINRLVFNENILSDFIVIALRESTLFRTNLLKLIDPQHHETINKVYINREKSLWNENNIRSSGRSDIRIDIYGKRKSSILIEHKIRDNISKQQIAKYCHTGRKLKNSYFILLSSKDTDIKNLEEATDIISSNYTNPPLYLTHYSILKLLIQTIKAEPLFPNKNLLFWLIEIVYNFQHEHVIRNEIYKFQKLITDSNFTITTLESCYG